MTHQFTTQRIHVFASFTCILVLLFSLSACSSQSKSKPTSSASASSAESFAITATEGIENPELPERPAEMDTYDENGAIAAAEYFLRLSLYGVATDNWDDYNALSLPNCGFCNSYRDKNHEDYKNISSRTMPEMEVQSAFAWQVEDIPGQWRADALVERFPSKVIDKDNVVHRHEAGTAALAFLLDTSNGWHVIDIESFDINEYQELYGEPSQ